MRRVMVRYRVKPDQVATNEELVRAVYEELGSSQPAGLRYATVQLEDGETFVHVAETEPGENPLNAVEAFKKFQEGIRDRCVEPPVVSELRVIGSFNLFDD
jgi:hypothetical protein